MIHPVKGIGVVNKAEVDASLELSCFFDDLMDVGNLTSGSSAFSKSNLNSAMATGWNDKSSFQSPRKAMPKNVQTTTQLHSSHMLAK